jgi:predicted dehydrogenase
MKRLRVGVIGAGSWALAAHLPALAKRSEVELVAVCRKGDDVLRKIQSDYDFAVASEDYRDVVAQELDLVVVSSPSALHHEHATAALMSGAHVLCEKPMAIDPAQAWDLVSTSEATGKQLLLSFGWNYMPIVRDSVAMLVRHDIGTLEHMTIHMSSATRELLSNTGSYPDASPESVPESSTWTDPRVSGGGYGQAQLSHALGLALRLVPERVSSAFAFTSAPLDAPVELHDAVSMTFDGGGIGVLSGGSSHVGAWGNKHELEVRAIGGEGQFIVDVHRELAWVFTASGTEERLDLGQDAGAYDPSGPANALVEVGLGNLDANSAPPELGARTVEALDLVYRSAASQAVARR